MKHSIRVVMKSGYSFSFLCDSMTTKTIGVELIGYAYERATTNIPMFIRVENVDAIIDEGEAEEGGPGERY